MTVREKLAKEHPDCVGNHFEGGAKFCPHTYGYESQKKDCYETTCTACWDREIPETEENKTHTKIADDIADVYHRLIDRGMYEGEAYNIVQSLINRGCFDK